MNSKVFLAVVLASMPAAANSYPGHASYFHGDDDRPAAQPRGPVAPSEPFEQSPAHLDATMSNRTRSDARIEYSANARLASAVGAIATNVDARAVRGALTLRGTVSNPADRERILVSAAGLPGVSSVRDELEVAATNAARGGGPTDRAAMQQSLDTAVESTGVQAAIDDGAVRLTGHVATYDDALAVLARVRQVAGVRTVRSELSIDESATVPVGVTPLVTGAAM